MGLGDAFVKFAVADDVTSRYRGIILRRQYLKELDIVSGGIPGWGMSLFLCKTQREKL